MKPIPKMFDILVSFQSHKNMPETRWLKKITSLARPYFKKSSAMSNLYVCHK